MECLTHINVLEGKAVLVRCATKRLRRPLKLENGTEEERKPRLGRTNHDVAPDSHCSQAHYPILSSAL